MSHSPFAHVVTHAFKESKHMPPVPAGKNRAVGFMTGFLFGPIGVGLYLRSPADFVMTLGLVIIGSVFSAGVAAPVLWCLCGAWTYVRISHTPPAATPA